MRTLLALVVAALFATPAAAQTPDSSTTRDSSVATDSSAVEDTTRLPTDSVTLARHFVRARLADGRLLTGIVRSVHGDTLTVDSPMNHGASFVIGASELRSLELRQPSPQLERNMNIAGVLGAVGGGVAFLSVCNRHPDACSGAQPPGCDGDYDDDSDCDSRALTMAKLFVGAGALVGIIVGYAMTPPVWRRVGVRLNAGVAPSPDGATASVGASVPIAVLGGRH